MANADQTPFPLVAWLDRRTPAQWRLVLVVVALYVAYRLLRWGAQVQLDRWWFDDLGAGDVWRHKLYAQVLLAAVAGVVSGAVMLGSNAFAQRVRAPAGQQTFRPIDLLSHRLGPAKGWLAVLVPLILTWTIASAATSFWEEWLVFRAAEPIGERAPHVGRDLSYHLFRLPLLDRTTSWLTSLLALTFAMAVVIYVLQGCLRLPMRGRRSSPTALRHLAVLAAAWFAARSVVYWFVDHPGLASSRVGRFDGAGFAAMHGPGLAYRPLAIGALIAAVALVAYAIGWLPGRWGLAAVGAVAVVHLALVVVTPPLLQRFVVLPAEAEREAPYLDANFAATRTAYGLEAVDVEILTVGDGIDPESDAGRLPLLDAEQLAEPFQILQGTRGTQITDVDIDRYPTDSGLVPVYVGARDLAGGQLPEAGWVQRHLVYTHGDGLVATIADEVGDGGGLVFNGLADELGLERPELYFSQELAGWYALVGTRRAEVAGSSFDAGTGVELDSMWRRLVVGLALDDYNLAVSSELTADTTLLYRRGLSDRINAVAPFLTLDGDPYPVIADGHVVWAVDAYTTRSTYPYAQFADTSGVSHGSPLRGSSVNYLRHSATVTVDGYDGTVNIYRRDDGRDPVLDVWSRILPDAFEPSGSIPDEIAGHLSFGQDGFVVQTNMAALYHVDEPATLFDGTDAWVVSSAPGRSLDDATGGPAPVVSKFAGAGPDAPWSIFRFFSPGASTNPSSVREELAAIAIGDHLTGELRLVRLESRDGRFITSPSIAQATIAADPDVSQLFTLLNANNSKVSFGPMTPVVTDDGVAWVRSVVVVGSTASATPRLHSVLAVSNGVVGIGPTADEAIEATGS